MEQAVYEFCADYSRSPSRGRRMIIYGENGSGKSHVAKSVHRWASLVSMHIPLVNAEQGMSRLADASYMHWPAIIDGFKKGEWDLEEFLNATLLVVDDIGAEHDPSGVGSEKLYMMLERRSNKWTIVTTNIGPGMWEHKFERRIADRLFRNFEHVDLSEVPSYSATQML